MTVRLLVADDHEVIRTGLATLLAGTDIEIVAEAATGNQKGSFVITPNISLP